MTRLVFFALGRFGVVYLLIVVPFYFVMRALSRFPRDVRDFWVVTAPMVLYLGLVWSLDRQGLNVGYGNVSVAAGVCLGLLLRATTRWTQNAKAAITTALGCAAAVTAWRLVPFVPAVIIDRLFWG